MNKKKHPVYAKANRIYSPLIWALAVLLLVLDFSLTWIVDFTGVSVIHLADVFTLIAACWLGALPGLFVGMGNAVLCKFILGTTIYHAFIPGLNVIIAVFVMRKGLFRKWWSYPLMIISLALLWGFFGQIFNYFLNGQQVDLESYHILGSLVDKYGWNPFWTQVLCSFGWELVDKAISVAILWSFFFFYPQDDRFLDFFPYTYLLKKPWGSFDKGLDKLFNSKTSIKNKILSITTLSYSFLGIVVIAILSSTYHDRLYAEYCSSISSLSETASMMIDGDKLESYFGNDGVVSYEGYEDTLNDLKIVAKSNDRVKDICVFRFEDEKAIAVFDTVSDNPYVLGQVLNAEEVSNGQYNLLIKGKEVRDVFHSNSDRGDLMTAYHTIKNSDGKVVAYALVSSDYKSISVATGVVITQVLSVEMITFLWGGIILYYIINLNLIAPLQIMNDELSKYRAAGPKNWKGSKDDRDKIIWELQNEIGELSHNIHRTEDEAYATFVEIENRTATIIAMEAGLVSALAEIVESRDLNTGDHIKRTSSYAKTLARAMAKKEEYQAILTKEYIDVFTTACTLHDVGKIAISDTILNKPGKLTPEEFEIMKTHTSEGVKLIDMAIQDVGDNAYLTLGREIAGCHHEKWDGSGYPLGLKEKEIPLPARIMAVVDVFDALMSKRSYKEAFFFEESVEIINNERGKHFDPEIVDVFMSILPKFKKRIEIKK